jgi:hypothetical protein
MWEEYNPARDAILCLSVDDSQDYPLGRRAVVNGVELAVVKRQPMRRAISEEVYGYFIYFKPADPQSIEALNED